jgi:ElaB/YqjD/DUF883 family membrane-anchored ribosome-binding protein
MNNRLAEYDQSQQVPASAWPATMSPEGPTMQQRVEAIAGQASRWIIEHPEIALTGAVLTGVVLGCLIKRR